MLCKATTKLKKRCQNAAMADSHYCHVHAALGEAKPVQVKSAPRQTQTPPLEQPAAQKTATTETPFPFGDLASSLFNSEANANGVESTDPLAALAAAVAAAAAQADQTPPEGDTPQPPTEFVSKMAYSAGYAVGYGVFFPAYLLLEMLPDPVNKGLRDGAKAAKDSVDQMRKGG